MKKQFVNFLFAFAGITIVWMNITLAETADEPILENKAMEVRRVGLADLDSILRAANANTRVRVLLDEQRKKFQTGFGKVEQELQQTERDLLSKRELLSPEEYEKQIAAFQEEVARLQQDIQKQRQAIDHAYQKAQNKIRLEALDVVSIIASELQLDLVLNRDSSLIFLPQLNISDEVLERLNERTKDARIEIEVLKPQSE
jgi:outer membrane protein